MWFSTGLHGKVPFSVYGAYISISSCFAMLVTNSKGNARAQAKGFFPLLTPDLRRISLGLLVSTKLGQKAVSYEFNVKLVREIII